jgi:triosephosphate isomerase
MNKTVLEACSFLKEFLGKFSNFKNEIIIAPSFVSLKSALKISCEHNLKIFAQNCHQCEEGAFTGEISAKMLSSIGVKGVILGHAERTAFGETPEIINQKIKSAVFHGLEVILCAGESSEKSFMENKLKIALNGIKTEKIIIAYEPIRAIGTGCEASEEDIKTNAVFIKKICSLLNIKEIKIIYGGSVNLNNYKKIINIKELDGLFIGKASLNVADFLELANF